MHFQKCKEGPYDIKVVICASDATQYHLVKTKKVLTPLDFKSIDLNVTFIMIEMSEFF